MKAIKLDCWANWKSLPWNYINEHIFILQKQIYEASKTCKYYSIHRVQNILVNSNEAKVLAIETIFKSLSKSSLNYNQDYYQLNNKDKFLIFHSLFQQQKIDQTLRILIEKIKQYLIYLCLQPEWESRFEPGLQSNIKGMGSYLFQEKLIRFLDYRLNIPKNFNTTYFDYQIINKYIKPKYIIQKIHSGVYVSYCLSFWLDNNYIEEFSQDLVLSLKFNILYQLLYRIICNGIEWFYYMTIEFQLSNQLYTIYENIVVCYERNTSYWVCINSNLTSNLTFIFKFLGLSIYKYSIYCTKYKNYSFCIPYSCTSNMILGKTEYPNILIVSNICKILFRTIKYILYKKDFINRLRANTSINIAKTILYINKLILQFYDCYCLFLPLRIMKKIYQQVDFIVYSWVKKRSKNKHSPKVTIHRSKKYLIKSLTKSKHNILNKICIEKINR